jgi:membrane fusion protein (multidrug efflux system)
MEEFSKDPSSGFARPRVLALRELRRRLRSFSSRTQKLGQELREGGWERFPLWAKGLLGLCLLLFLGWLLYESFWTTTNDAYVTGNVAPVKAQTSGTVVEVRYDDTQFVRKGETLVRLDGLKQKVALDRAVAELGSAVRKVETLFSQVESLRQKIASQKAELQRLQYDLSLYRAGSQSGVISQQQAVDTQWKVEELQATIRQLEADLAAAEALVQGTSVYDNPIVTLAAAHLRDAYLDWVRCRVIAPVSGYVAKRTVQPGDQVTPEKLLMTVVPLDYLWVVANYRETELRHVRPGQRAVVTADLHGRRVRYHGVVEGLLPGTGSVFALLPPDNATGNYIHVVERLGVRIRLDPRELQEHPLQLGLSLVTRIWTLGGATSVLEPLTAIPAEAHANDYRSHPYEEELEGADRLIRQTIEANCRPTSLRRALPKG